MQRLHPNLLLLLTLAAATAVSTEEDSNMVAVTTTTPAPAPPGQSFLDDIYSKIGPVWALCIMGGALLLGLLIGIVSAYCCCMKRSTPAAEGADLKASYADSSSSGRGIRLSFKKRPATGRDELLQAHLEPFLQQSRIMHHHQKKQQSSPKLYV